MYSIETKHLTKYFYKEKSFFELLKHPIKRTRVIALDNVNMAVKYGEIYGILGPNGAGKTTLLKILSTLILPDSGNAYIEGIDILKEPEEAKYSIGLIYGEERSFYWRLTGKENLEFYATLYNVPKEKIEEDVNYVLKVVGLKEKASFRIGDYSTGMKHRLAIARGLLANPRILLMDEPTLGVDPLGRETIQNLIKDIVKETGKTVLLVTHDLEEAKKMCDRVAIMDRGKMVSEISNVKSKNLDMIFKRVVKE